MKLAAGAATDRGRQRDNNEDAFLVDDRRALFAVADGMGGHRGGEVASHTAIEALRAAVASGDGMEDAITRANGAVLERARGNDDLSGMGTTMTAVIAVDGTSLLVGHVGDSRAYLLRDGELRRVTDDHSLVEELVREGRLTPEQAESHPQRAIVTRALGVDPDVDVDLYTLDVAPSDRVLLCSDGLTTMLRDRDVQRVARGISDPQHAAEALVAAANEAGGDDNITVIVIDVLEVDERTVPPAPEATAVATATDGASTRATVLGDQARPAVSIPAPDVAETAPREPRRSRVRAFRRAVLVLLPLVLILAVAVGTLGWYARRSYYVGAVADEVVIYKGVPGGVLGWDPTVDEHTGVALDRLPEADRQRVTTNASRGSLSTARSFVARLRNEATTTTTTTFAPTTARVTTTTKPRSAGGF